MIYRIFTHFSSKSKSILVKDADQIGKKGILRAYFNTVVAGKVEEGIMKHAPMSGGENKAISIEPIWILGVIPHYFIV